MDFSTKQLLALKFCFEAGKGGKETFEMVNAHLETKHLPTQKGIEDNSMSGPSTHRRSNENVEKIVSCVKTFTLH